MKFNPEEIRHKHIDAEVNKSLKYDQKVEKIARSIAKTAIRKFEKGKTSFAPRRTNIFPLPLWSNSFVHQNFRHLQNVVNQQLRDDEVGFSVLIDPGIEGGLPVPSIAYLTEQFAEGEDKYTCPDRPTLSDFC